MSSIEFSAKKQTELFEILKQRQFSGQLRLSDTKQRQWTFYLSSGRIIYATGGIHPVRRWQRNLTLATDSLPEIPSQPEIWQASLEKTAPESLRIGWEYQLLCYWIDRQSLTLEQATKAIWCNLVEVFFDLSQAGQISYEAREDKSLSSRVVAIDAQQAIAAAEKVWQGWQAAKAAKLSPHLALAIEQSDKLQQHFSPQQYQSLIKLGNGEYTLHDLAVRLKRDVVTIARLFLPYVESGLLKLVAIPDLPPPVSLPVSQATKPATAAKPPQPQLLIACVDDSPLICYFMETIIKKAGCQFVGINNSVEAVKILSESKPDLIFLDLIMPKIDGYEVCSQLRKLPDFRRTPIVILTGNDGLIDRVKAKLVGSSGFINKPVKAETIFAIIRKHLKAASEQLTLDAESEIRYRGRPLKLN
jgi:two-component system, chemotaxis family, response regulator PixG